MHAGGRRLLLDHMPRLASRAHVDLVALVAIIERIYSYVKSDGKLNLHEERTVLGKKGLLSLYR